MGRFSPRIKELTIELTSKVNSKYELPAFPARVLGAKTLVSRIFLCSYPCSVGKNLLYLDRLRALAVIGVLVVHTSQFSLANISFTTSAETAILTILSAGRFGVEVFFFLSGFLLSFLYETGRSEKSNKQYFLARFLRVWPLWILFSVVWSVIFSFFLQNGSKETVNLEWILVGAVLSAFFLLWVSPDHHESFIGGAWSIQIEVICYLIFSWLRGKSVSAILSLSVVVNVLGLALSFTGDLDGVGVLDALRRLSLQTGVNFFVLGWLIARVYSHQMSQARSLNQSLRASAIEVFSGNEALVGVWLTSFLLTPAIYGNPIEAVGFVALTAVVAQISGKSILLSRLLENTGKLSYFMFFMHFVILYLANFLIPISSRPDSLATGLIFNSVAILLIFIGSSLPAVISLKYFEKPIMSLARRPRKL